MTDQHKKPKKAMILAAGLGKRMRPITNRIPKPLVEVAKRTLVDRIIDRLVDIDVRDIVVNLHHLGHLLQQHLERRDDVTITFIKEDDILLETGGGVANAIDHFGNDPFFAINGDTLWLNGAEDGLMRLVRFWKPETMDAALLLHSTVDAYGYSGLGDFLVDPMGKLTRRPEREVSPYLFTGVQILKPELFTNVPEGPFSLNVIYDRVLEEEKLFGIVHDGEWFHIGTPNGLAEAEQYMQERYAETKHR